MSKRFHMELSEDARERLERIRDGADLGTLSNAAREALQTYEFFFNEYMDYDAEFFIKRKGSEIEKIRLFRDTKR